MVKLILNIEDNYILERANEKLDADNCKDKHDFMKAMLNFISFEVLRKKIEAGEKEINVFRPISGSAVGIFESMVNSFIALENANTELKGTPEEIEENIREHENYN